jgi:DNA-binding MarR family transcriptional regulator
MFQSMTDEVCHDILREFLGSRDPLTQKALTASLSYDSSTISRRMGELEDLGIVRRGSGHAPYRLQFREQIRDLLRAGAELARLAHAAQAADLASDIEDLDNGATVAPSTEPRAGGVT